MNQRQARQEAYKRACSLIRTALEGSDAEWLASMYGEADALKVEAALEQLAEQLGQRGGP